MGLCAPRSLFALGADVVSARLESWYVADHGPGSMRLRLVNTGPQTLDGFQLAFTSVIQLTPMAGAQLVSRVSGWHVVAPPEGGRLQPGEAWEFVLACGFRPGHANDGPSGAYLVLADGTTEPVRTAPTGRAVVTSARPLRLDIAGSTVAAAWVTAAERERRLHPDDSPVLTGGEGDVVSAAIDETLGAEEFTIAVAGPLVTVAAGSPQALQHAFASLARQRREGSIRPGRHIPAYGWRGLHVDLARQFLPAADVEWLIDVAAWRGLNRLHLHLTDDEAWRVPIAAFPALTDVGAWRGHGLAIPPLYGSGAAPFGGSYTRAEIARWVERATAAGVVLVPEVDLPGHCFAALAAVPELRDPADRSGAVSVQSFVDNVLNPGVAATRPFLETVAGELADLFPSPWLHVGGDEVPAGAWSGSPAAQAYAAARGRDDGRGIDSAFMAEIIEIVTSTTGRRVGVWQEAAEAGALHPGDGYVVGWRSSADCRRLAAAGHTVVAAPAEVYYLDMAADTAWESPGMSWAGHSSVADIEAFDPAAAWSEAERERLAGIQACLWTEHAPDRPTLERLLFPRLDAIAAAAWAIRP